jgi:hypothetical protein
MQPVIGRVTGFHDQVEPARSRFASRDNRVLFPAGFEMIGHLAFAQHPTAKPTLCRSEFAIHSSNAYTEDGAGASLF